MGPLAVHPDAARRLGHSGTAPPVAGPEFYDVVSMRAEMEQTTPEVCGVGDRRVVAEDLPADVLGQPARLYRYPEAVGLPVVLALHGGGWVSGSLDTHDVLWRRMATAGLAVAALDYRLAPEHPYPAAFDDVVEAVRRVPALTGWDVDASRIGLVGDSAGGNLAAAAAIHYAGRRPRVITAQVLVYPVMNAELSSASYDRFGSGFGLTRQKMAFYWDSYCRDAGARTRPAASPAVAQVDPRELPSTLVITAECDVLRDESESYAQWLAEGGCDALSVRYQGVSHGFFRMHRAFRAGGLAADQAARFLCDRLDGARADSEVSG